MNSQPEGSIPFYNPQPIQKWWVMVGIGLGVLMYTIDTKFNTNRIGK